MCVCVCVVFFWRGWNRTPSNNGFTIWLDLSLDNFSQSGVQVWVELWKRCDSLTPLKLICRSSYEDLFSNTMLAGNHVWTARNTAPFLWLLGEHRSFWAGDDQVVQYWNILEWFFSVLMSNDSRRLVITSALVECSFQPFALPIGPGNSGFSQKSNVFFFPLRERKTWKQTMASKGTNILKQCKHGQIWRNWWLLCLVLGHMNVDLSGTQTPIEKKVVCQVESKLPKNWLSVFGPFW